MKKLILLAIPAAFALAFTTNVYAADGRPIYADNCTKCHGDDGKGQTKMGQKLQVRDYTDAKVQDSFTDDQAFKADQFGDFIYSSDGTNVTITGYTGPNITGAIPDNIDTLPVTTIGDFAFYGFFNLTEVTIPEGVTSIESMAFGDCHALTTVT